jgi:hypothetical protein
MRVLYGVLLIVSFFGCATSTGGSGTGANDQVSAATSAWRTVVTLDALRRCMTLTPYFGARPQKRLLQIQVQLLSISKTPQNVRTQESLLANSTFGFMVT